MNHRALLLTPLLWLFALALPKSQPIGCPTANPVLVTNNAASGTNSLRWAIECVNAVTPLTTINFSPGVSIISLAGSSPLPTVTKNNAQINGPANTTVILDGAGLSVPANGLTFQANNAAVRNLSIRNFAFTAAGSGIHFPVGNGLLVENCRLYSNVNGVTASGSDVAAGANNLTVTGCNIGLNEAGAPAGNSQNGVRLSGAFGTALNASIRFSNIAHNGAAGVNTSNNVVADIRNNSMYCNPSGGIVRTGGSQQGAPAINPNSNYNILIGNAQPNSSVQLFVHDNTGCAGNPPCQGRTLLATVNAAPINGLWTYTPPAGSLPNQAQITATATLGANTSVFSTCLTLPDCSALQAGLTPLPPLCFGQSNGAVNANVSGGQPNFNYLWSNGFITPNLNNVPAGFYSLTVTDNAGCTTEESVQLTQPPQMTLNTLQNNVSCFGLSDGAIQSFPGGGTPGYFFQWSNGAMTQDVGNIPAGTYSLTVNDANGCTEVQSVVVTQPPALSLTLSGADAPCFGQAGGSAQAMGGGGTPGYSYQWSNGQSGPNAAGLAAGVYTVILSDLNNCTLTQSVNIGQPPALTLNAQAFDATCFGLSNGSIQSFPGGGTPGYGFQWSNSANTQNQSNIPAGTYTLTLSDANNCTETQTVTVGQPTQITLNALQSNVSCFGLSDGAIQSFPAGGMPGYFFQWSNGAMTQDLDNLPAGTYTLNISDANGCSETQTVVITQPPALSLTLSGADAPCFGQAGGSAQAMGGGGTPGYSYQWSNGQSGPNAAGLTAGAYTVTLSDQNNCTLIQSVNIAEAPELLLSLMGVNPADSAAADGLAYAQYAGGTPPYQLQWSNGATTDSIGGLPPGVYTLTLRDANNCAVSETVLLTASSCIPLPAYALLAPAQVCNNASFLLQADDLYPSPNVQYIWLLPTGDSLRTVQSFVNVPVSSPAFGGEYRVIRDSLGCLSPPLGGALVQVITVSGVSAGQDSVICTAGVLTLRAQKPTAFQGEWSSLGAATIDNPNAATTIARNLQSGPNQFVYRVATALCPDAASDTVTYFLERPPVLRDDAYTLKRAFDQVVMEVLLNDDLRGLSDTSMLQIGAPTIGDLFFDPAARRFRYTAPEEFRGDVSFRYVVCFPNPVCPVNPSCDTAVVVIRVENLPQVPEGLITDDPGANGRFTLKGTGGYSRIDVRIVNRWGDLVFEDKDYGASPPWTGDYQRSGKALPDGAYFYQITLYSTGLEPQTLVGAVHLFSQKN